MDTYALTDITSYAIASNGLIVGCGDNVVQINSGVFKIDRDGRVKFLNLFGV